MRLDKIARYLGGELSGPGDIEIVAPAKIEQAQRNEITFLANKKYKNFVKSTQAGAIILAEKIDGLQIPAIIVEDAYVAFVQVLSLFQPPMHEYIKGVSPLAFVDQSATVHHTVSIAPFVYIGPHVHIGENTVLYPGVVLLENVRVGKDCVLYPNVSVREKCLIGNRVILHNGCAVGSDGFGFAPRKQDYVKIPQMGKVIIEDDVEIGANCTIDRATIGETIIGQGTKLDNLVQVAHNVIIGKNTVIASQSGISGSTVLEDHVTIGGQVGVVGHIKIHKNAVLAAQSGVTKNVQEGAVLWGTPAGPINERKKIEVSLRRLPETVKKVKALENEISELRKKLTMLEAEKK